MECKTVTHSAIVVSAVMQPNQANPGGNVHGGEIMKMMDNAAFVAAQRHARSNVVTARVDELTFLEPILVGNWVSCLAKVTFVGRSSMEVSVTVEVEDLYSEALRKKALTGYFTMIAVNAGGKPIAVSSLETTTDEERHLFEEGRVRYERYKQRRQAESNPE